MLLTKRAAQLVQEFKGSDYAFGLDVLKKSGEYAAEFGKSALVICNATHQKVADEVISSLKLHNMTVAGERVFPGAGPNTPREDVYRIESYFLHFRPDVVLVIGGGSSIDAVKAANVLASLGRFSPDIDSYFGVGLVSEALAITKEKLWPLIAIETASSSGAHLTKYSNITDPVGGQKKLIVDEAIIPTKAVFDYATTASMPPALTVDGALDGLAHCLEVFYGVADSKFELVREITEVALALVLDNLPKVLKEPGNLEARQGLGLATDLGGYGIMIGGTNGAHLTSFSLVDLTTHGRACGIMNPYYTVFFAPAIERQLRVIGGVFIQAGLLQENLDKLSGRDLGIAVAKAMVEFSRSVQSPTTLGELPGFTDAYIAKALDAAKNPQLKMKLTNMPVQLSASLVDEYMGPILWAAKTGDFRLIKNLTQ